jgi:ammonium transporter, Amt family
VNPTPVSVFLVLLAPFAIAGLALINTGLGRARGASLGMLSALFAAATAVLVYCAFGSSIQGLPGGWEGVIHLGGKPFGWIGGGRLLMRDVAVDSLAAPVYLAYGMFAVALAAVIPLGTGAERWRMGASCASAAILAGFIFPVFAHWIWGGGWLTKLVQYGLVGNPVDAGGAGAIHVVGGLTALTVAWILGPRSGKYTREGMPVAVPGHNAVLVSLGCMAAWIGFTGIASAGATLFGGADAMRVALVAINLTLSASAGTLTAGAITRARFGKVDASLCANGWVAGLVAASAGCASMRPAAAAIVGAVGSAAAIYAIEWMELQLSIDDPGGSISVHAISGIWGLLAAGVLGGPGQWLPQLVEIASLVGFVLPLAYGANWALDRVFPQRVPREAERQGMDLHMLGAGAYPDFVTHGEDSWMR